MLLSRALNRLRFSTITHIRGRSEHKPDDQVQLRGIHMKSTQYDAPNFIFIPEAFDQAENWLQFFSNPINNIIQKRNIWILYPRNFGNSDKNPEITWESQANDIARFMYSNRISMATLGGHGIGGKIALAAACYHNEKVTGFVGIDTVPYDQYYFEPYQELRSYVQSLKDISMSRPFSSISFDIKNRVKCPKWRTLFESNVTKHQSGYTWKFDLQAIADNIKLSAPNSLIGWSKTVGLYPGRVCYVFPQQSRYVYLNTNTLPILKVCPHSKGFLRDIFAIQGDNGTQNHWVYENDENVNPYAYRISNFLKHYDGVHTLLQNRQQVGRVYVPERNEAHVNRQIGTDVRPGHYYHNWRFNNVYGDIAQRKN